MYLCGSQISECEWNKLELKELWVPYFCLVYICMSVSIIDLYSTQSQKAVVCKCDACVSTLSVSAGEHLYVSVNHRFI